MRKHLTWAVPVLFGILATGAFELARLNSRDLVGLFAATLIAVGALFVIVGAKFVFTKTWSTAVSEWAPPPEPSAAAIGVGFVSAVLGVAMLSAGATMLAM